MSVSLARIDDADIPWDEIGAAGDGSVFRSKAWTAYVATVHGGSRVVLEVEYEGEVVGWFVGVGVRKFGLPMLGSPLPGWGTSYMGFAWSGAVDQSDRPAVESAALLALRRWAVDSWRFVHLEVMVDQPPVSLLVPPAMGVAKFHSYRCDLVDDLSMLKAMSTNGRRNLRRAELRGVRVESVPVQCAHEFVDQYYSMALAVFALKGTRPAYPQRRVQQLIDAVGPTGDLLLLRAMTGSGEVAATNITVGRPSGTAVLLMGASDRAYSDLRPSDAIMWESMKMWRDRGAARFDFGGGGSYKRKFGGRPVEASWVHSSVLPGTSRAREMLRRIEATKRRGRRDVLRSDPQSAE